MSDRLLGGNWYFPVDGHFISQKQIRINEILQDYDPNLQLQWIPPNKRSKKDLAFRVVDMGPGHAPYAICFAEEVDERLLARVFEADQRNSPNKLTFIENYNNALELVRAKDDTEERQELHEMATAVLRNNKSSYTIKINGEVIDFERPGRRHKSKTYIW